jgi:hypothetical protein
MGEFIYDVFSDGQAFLVGRLRMRKALRPHDNHE